MPASTIRVATIGTWGHLGEVLAELSTMPDAKLVAHARAMPDEDLPHLHRIAGTDQIPWHDDYRQMLREVKPDVVVISTRIDRINPIAIEAAEAGCHLICEKPLAIEHAALTRLYQACIAHKVQCIAMLGNGRHPAMQGAASVLRSGEAGKIILVNARKSYRWGSNRPEWFGDRKMYGGTIGWIAIHALEMIHLLSQEDFTSVSAVQSNLAHLERPDCEDNGVLSLRLSGGGSASVSFDFLRPAAAVTHGDDWVRAVGSNGIVEASLDYNWCKFTSNDLPQRNIALPEKAPYFSTFLRALASCPQSPLPEMRRAFMLTHVCLCARDAADRQTVEPISNQF